MKEVGMNKHSSTYKRLVSRLASVTPAVAVAGSVLLGAPSQSYAWDPGKEEARRYKEKKKRAKPAAPAAPAKKKHSHKASKPRVTQGRLRAGEEARERARRANANRRSKSKWFSLGCGTKGGGAVPWGNVAAPTRIRVKSLTVTGAPMQWTAGGTTNAAWAPPLTWATFSRGASIGASDSSKTYYSWATQPGSTAYVCVQARGFE
jgi:hypothetical protein